MALSAAEVHPGPGAAQLDFFDDLDGRPLVTQDDTLHAVLLVLRGSSAATYVQRAAIAKSMGWLEMGANPQPRDAATAGELAQMLIRAVGMAPAKPAEALAVAQDRGLMPVEWHAARGMTGGELVGVLRAAARERGTAAAPVSAP